MSKGYFENRPAMRQVDRWTWELVEPLVFVDPVYGRIVVPVGERSDLASILFLREVARWALILAALAWAAGAVCALLLPLQAFADPLLWTSIAATGIYAVLAGYAVLAAFVHDFLYRTGQLPRAAADAVLYRACRAEGEARWRAFIFWIGPRLGGASHYHTGSKG
ncbi:MULTISPECIES: DUF1353 domain-containing protein [Pseudomonas]|uniref:DUF1353 domain-containing protein n=1 Tax=Pseudomonas TaxID=286 RepID=UPI00165DFBA9|nr:MULTISPECIES: DUF1353 domain-containing protein [Pseudomonas]QNQ98257.1 hypothetical protein BGI51_11535 [Pseudomonas psychrotolerans]